MNAEDIWTLPQYPFREGQKETIENICDAIDDGYTNIVLHAGTGAGKSPIATSIINYVDNCFLITKTKQLQQQYIDDFPSILTNIKGRNNYLCNYNETSCWIQHINKYNLTAEKYYMLDNSTSFNMQYLNSLSDIDKEIFLTNFRMWYCNDCAYLHALRRAQNAPNVLTNYDYFWYSAVRGDNFDVRDLLVIDEAHTLERKIMGFISLTLSQAEIYEKYEIDIFEDRDVDDITSIEYWVNMLYQIIDAIEDKEYDTIQKVKNKIPAEQLQNIRENFDNQKTKYSDMIHTLTTESYVVNIETDEKTIQKKYWDLSVKFSPLYPIQHIHKFLSLGHQRLFMTATLGNIESFCKYLGLDKDDTYYCTLKSPFKISNRPIITDYAGYFSGRTNNQPNWRTHLCVDKCKEIVNKHYGENGVIHTNSNEQTDFLYNNLSFFNYNIYRINGDEENNRDLSIKRFINDNNPSILIGASIKDGVNFEGDLCRFQICTKIPYLYLGDAQIKAKKEEDENWYYYQTIIDLVQSYGRGIRSENDYCTYYIIDSAFRALMYHNSHLIDDYFTEAVNIKRKEKHKPAAQGNILKQYLQTKGGV